MTSIDHTLISERARDDGTTSAPTRGRRRPHRALATAAVMCVFLAACGGGGNEESAAGLEAEAVTGGTSSTVAPPPTTEMAPTTPEESEDPPSSTAPVFDEGAEVLTSSFSPVEPGTYRVDSLGTPFSATFEGDWVVQPNEAGLAVFSHPESQRPGDRDVTFVRPSLLSDPTQPGASLDAQAFWSLDDIEGWLDNVIDGVAVSAPEAAEVGGRSAVSFEAEVTDAEICGAEFFCAGFIVNVVHDDGRISGASFEPGFHSRVYWVDGGDQPPVAVIVGSPSTDDSFEPQVDALLATLAFGEPQPHPANG